jgi:transposase-like protein
VNTVGCSWKDVAKRAFPEEFRRDVVEIARSSRLPRKKIAEDFGISPATLSNWLKADEVTCSGFRAG